MSDWYECIEEPIRPLVKLLRDSGINTICSCGHEMYCQCEYRFDDLHELYDLLYNKGYQNYRIVVQVEYTAEHRLQKILWVYLPMPDGSFSSKG